MIGGFGSISGTARSRGEPSLSRSVRHRDPVRVFFSVPRGGFSMTKSRFSTIPFALGILFASSLIPGSIVSADDEDSVTTKSRIEVDKGDGDSSISTTVRSEEKGDDHDTTVTKETKKTVKDKDDDTTVTKSTKKTVRGKDVDAEDVEEED
jgi:hypothetical protein